jgi:hypothetical protein
MRHLASLALSLLLVTLALGGCARREVVLTSMAETDTEVRGRAEYERISAGVAAGTIDPLEAERLGRTWERIYAYQNRAVSDGVLSLREQRRLARYHARFDRAITRAISR